MSATIHLTDAQRDTFAACGLIVIDGERRRPPKLWRKLAAPCPTCKGNYHQEFQGEIGAWVATCPDCVGGRRVVTLTATCPTCTGDDETLGAYATCMECERCEHCGLGVVTLGRFTIPALLPVVEGNTHPDYDHVAVQTGEMWLCIVGRDGSSVRVDPPLDPLPQPGQFVAKVERVDLAFGLPVYDAEIEPRREL